MGYEKILVPLDGSDFSEFALRHVPMVAAPGAQIHLVSVVDTRVIETFSLAPELWNVSGENLADTKTYLARVASMLTQQGYSVTTEALAGPVVPLVAQVSERGFDLIIMATHRRNAIGRFILGSVSERLLHEAHCPMLIV